MKTLRLIVAGHVQGVGYRAWAVREARGLGLAGWVRNRSDGSVEALAAGPDEAVDRFVDACRLGPRAAAVDGISVTSAEGEASGPFVERATV